MKKLLFIVFPLISLVSFGQIIDDGNFPYDNIGEAPIFLGMTEDGSYGEWKNSTLDYIHTCDSQMLTELIRLSFVVPKEKFADLLESHKNWKNSYRDYLMSIWSILGSNRLGFENERTVDGSIAKVYLDKAKSYFSVFYTLAGWNKKDESYFSDSLANNLKWVGYTSSRSELLLLFSTEDNRICSIYRSYGNRRLTYNFGTFKQIQLQYGEAADTLDYSFHISKNADNEKAISFTNHSYTYEIFQDNNSKFGIKVASKSGEPMIIEGKYIFQGSFDELIGSLDT